MQSVTVQAPVTLLMDPDLTAAAKVLWLVLHTRPTGETPVALAAGSRLAESTVRLSLARLQATGLYAPTTGAIDPFPAAENRVLIPAGLLSEAGVRPHAKLLYGILQTLPSFGRGTGELSYPELSTHARLSAVTVREAVRDLAEAGWIQASQKNRLAPVRYRLRNPVEDRSAAEAEMATQRITEADYRGEEIMKEFLSLLIDCDEFDDNARPGWLVNPLTDERMELDRYYPPAVGFEFHGSQHFRTTKRFPCEKALAMRKARDLMKEALCARRGVQVVVVTAPDLTLAAMQQKVGKTPLPLREVRGREQLIEALEQAGRRCRA